jgi:hypothetical protein
MAVKREDLVAIIRNFWIASYRHPLVPPKNSLLMTDI